MDPEMPLIRKEDLQLALDDLSAALKRSGAIHIKVVADSTQSFKEGYRRIYAACRFLIPEHLMDQEVYHGQLQQQIAWMANPTKLYPLSRAWAKVMGSDSHLWGYRVSKVESIMTSASARQMNLNRLQALITICLADHPTPILIKREPTWR